VIAGFEPLDLLMAVWMLVRQIQRGKAVVENEYVRAVKPQGNRKAQHVMQQVFEPVDVKWRGFPVIPQSGLRLRKKFESYDARKKYEDELVSVAEEEFAEPIGCRCGEVLRGLISSKQCPLFGRECTPENPVGPCMVSNEGNCHIQYRYTKK
jgi:hydrogenase expression/formation protein HypD